MSGFHVSVAAVVTDDYGDFHSLTREVGSLHRARLMPTITALVEQAMAIHDFRGWTEDSTVRVTVTEEQEPATDDDPPAS